MLSCRWGTFWLVVSVFPLLYWLSNGLTDIFSIPWLQGVAEFRKDYVLYGGVLGALLSLATNDAIELRIGNGAMLVLYGWFLFQEII